MGQAQSDVERYDEPPERAGWHRTKVNIAKQSDKYLMGKVGHEGPRQGEPLRYCCYCPDILFFLLWFTCSMIIIVLGLHYGIVKNAAVDDDDYGQTSTGSGEIFALITVAIVWAMALSVIWMLWSVRSGNQVTQTMIVLGVIALIIVGFAEDVSSYQWYFGIGLILIAICGALSYYVIRDSARHRIVTLTVGCHVVKNTPGLECLMIVTVILCGILSLFFAFGVVGLLYHFQGNGVLTDLEQLNNKNTSYIMLLLMYLYCANVLRNIMVTTTAGTVAEWWYRYTALNPEHHAAKPTSHDATCDTYCRSWTYSLPPICYGSLVIPAFETIWSFVASCKDCCAGLCGSCADVFDKCAELYHGYAFVFIGTHGYSLMTAGRKTFSLFVNEGLSVMQNDCVVETMGMWADITIGVLTSCFSIMLVDHGPEKWTLGVDCPRTLCGLIGLFVGFGISGVATGVVVGANKTVLVLFLENPHVLEDTHPNEHKELMQAWRLVEKKEVPHSAHITIHEPEDGEYGLA